MLDRTASAPGDTAGQTQQRELESAEAAEPPEPTCRYGQVAAGLTAQRHSGRTVDLDWIRHHLALVVGQMPRSVVRVDIAIVDDRDMRSLHRQHHHVDETTDVLTFEASSNPAEPLEVDIAVCSDVAERHAMKRGHSVEQELLLYIVHGMLHCCGYDDQSERASAVMHREEDRILDAIGVGSTFHGGLSGDDCPPLHKDSAG